MTEAIKKQAPFGVRFPAGMRERLAASARANRRSMNAELIVLLEASLSRQSVSAVLTQPERAPAISG